MKETIILNNGIFDYGNEKAYPPLCTIDRVWRFVDYNFNKIWENLF